MQVRFKADFTVEAESVDGVKEQFARYLLGEAEKPQVVNYNDGWCVGNTKYWHYVIGCWSMK